MDKTIILRSSDHAIHSELLKWASDGENIQAGKAANG